VKHWNTALMTAVRSLNFDVVKFLLKNGADINKKTTMVIHLFSTVPQFHVLFVKVLI
jgi:hypothetical protein